MKNYLLPVLLFLSSTCLMAQSPDFVWARRFGGALRHTPVGLDLDASGNIYTSGYFKGVVDFDPGAGTYTLSSNGDIAAFVSKLDAQGNFVWARCMSTFAPSSGFNAQAWGQTLCANGDVCLTGSFQGLIDFDPGPATNLMYAPTPDIFVVRLDAQGNFLWAKQVGGINTDLSSAIAADAAGALYTTGLFVDTVDFDPGPGTFTLAAPAIGYPEAFILKLDAAGNFAWAKKLATTAGAAGVDVTLDAAGNIYSTGSFRDTSDFDPGAGTYTLAGAGGQDVYVLKLDAAGNFVWAKSMGGSTADSGISLVTDGSGNLCLAGFFTGSGDFDPGAGVLNFTSAGNNDMFISKFDALGNLLWAKATGGTGNEVASSLAVDASGSIYSTGYFENTVDFDPGVASYTLSTAATNAFISKFDAQGNFNWAKHLPGSAYNAGSALAVDAGSAVYSTGSFSSTTDFDPNAGSYTLSPMGTEDVYVHKMRCGAVPNVSAVSTASTICAGNSVTLSALGASTYSWNAGSGGTITVSPATTTTYTLVGTDANGCSTSINVMQIVSACTGIAELAPSAGQLAVYPNPTHGLLTISTTAENKELTLLVINAVGELIKSERSVQASPQLNIENLPAGLYFIKVISNQQTLGLIKIIKE